MLERFTKLKEEIRSMEHEYYVLCKPTKSDFDYDTKLKQLEALEKKYPEYITEDSPTRRVGVDLVKGFETVKHSEPMLSLKNTYSLEELEKQIISGVEYVTELKYDGLAMSLHYENGILVKALTRGDGEYGTNVLSNVVTIKSIPLQLSTPETVEIRGEVVMPIAIFEKLNKEREELEEELFKNPRNAAAGSIKSHRPKDTAKRGLDFYAYSIIGSVKPRRKSLTISKSGSVVKFQSEDLITLEELGFKTWCSDSNLPVIVRKVSHDSFNSIRSFINVWEKFKVNIPYAIDGIVIKVNNKDSQKSLGSDGKYPKWAYAYKYKAEEKSTKILSITYQVGVLGSITPVAELEPIELSGSTVKRVTLNNFKWIADKGLYTGDYVIIEKAGEIIPKLLRVDLSKRDKNAKPIVPPAECPCCGSTLAQIVNVDGTLSASHYCLNTTGCLDQIKGKLEKFCSKKAMDISGMGPKTIDALVTAGFISNIESLYTLDLSQLTSTIGETTGVKLLEQINNSKLKPYSKLLYGLSIPAVGSTTSKQLTELFPNLESLVGATYEELTESGVSELIAENLITFWADENKQTAYKLRELGLKTELEKVVQASESLSGKLVVISGNFGTALSKEHLKQLVGEHGGKLQSSVNSKTSFVVAGDKMGWKKKEGCEKLGISIITESEFLAKISST